MGTAKEQDPDEVKHLKARYSQIEERKLLPNKLKYLTASALFYGNIALGCGLNTYGPAATSMQNKYDTDDDTISKAFTILTGSYMVGALCASLVFHFINRQLAVIIFMATMGVMQVITPHCPAITLFFLSAGVMGFSVGCYDVAQFVWMMEMMQKDCPPYVQCQHFAYALGTNLVSFIMAPFLDKDDEDEEKTLSSFILEDSGYSHVNGNISMEAIAAKKSESSKSDGSKLFIPYAIVGLLMILSAVSQLLLFVFMRYHPPPPEIMDDDQKEKENEVAESGKEVSGYKIGSWSLAKFRMVVLAAAFYGSYQGMEMTTIQFFPKFGQNSDLALSESDSTYVLTGMTAAYAVGRGLAIIAVFKISLQLILGGNIALVVIANILLVGWASTSLPVLWASSIIFGIGFSSMFGAFSAFIERYLVFTNFVGSIMIVAASGLSAIYPLIIGKFIENNVIVLSYTNFFSITLNTIAVGTLSFLTYRNKTRY